MPTDSTCAPLWGLLLTGGRSERMTRDKTELVYQGLPQLTRAGQLLQACCEQVFVSARADQHDALRQQWPVIVDQHPDIGPLAGIAAAQQQHPHVAWLVIACDLPWLDQGSLQQLVYGREPQRAATAFRMPDRELAEPLCTIWEPASAAAVEQAIRAAQHSPQKLLGVLNALLIAPDKPLTLRNVNTLDDYQAALKELSASLTLTVQYFAVFREQAGARSEVVHTTAGTAGELYEELKQRHGFRLLPAQLKVAINNEFRDWHTALASGDVVTFIPPVAGG